MPSQADHKTKAKKFLELYEATPDAHPDGKAIALFYCALHLVEMVAAINNEHNRDHRERRNYIQRNHRDMWKHYRPLLEASEQARYLACGGLAMNTEQIEHQLRRKRLRAFELWSESILNPTTKEPAVKS